MHAVLPEPSLLSTCAKWAYIRHILSVETQTRLSMHAVLLEPSLLSHMHKICLYTAYSISQCSYAPEHACCLAKAFTALAHAQNGRSYGIFFSVKGSYVPERCAVMPEPSLLSHMHKMGVHMVFFSVNVQTRLSMQAVLPESSLLWHLHKMGMFMASFISHRSDAPVHACSLARAFTALAHAQNRRTYGIFSQSILRRDKCMQSCKSLHCSHTCTI